MLLELGPANVQRRVLELAGQVESIVRDTGARVIHSGGNIIAARWEDRDANVLAASLRE